MGRSYPYWMPMPVTTSPKHDYQACDDDDCPRFGCRAYRDGVQAGYERGFAGGYAVGHAEGYMAGWADGSASAGDD